MCHPYWPIIYVRGYAMTSGEIDETAADPFCGFNLGSTTYRAVADRSRAARKFVFESPVIRLGKDFGYKDTYRDGAGLDGVGWEDGISANSIVIYRYYDDCSALLGGNSKPDIPTFAKGLSNLILRVRELVCKKEKLPPDDFRCHLVAHSMGGLVCRAFLQNSNFGEDAARRCIDKFFTYATPHNGIEMAGVNVPEWLSLWGMNTFNRDEMASYLALDAPFKATQRVDWVNPKTHDPERFFCMVGSDRGDYEVAWKLSRTFAGQGSDGLVRIANASLGILDENGHPTDTCCARAMAYRSHSGYFGIVNGEESYQNLIRFLFGDTRVEAYLDIDQVTLPNKVQKAVDTNHRLEAVYQIEALASVIGKPWYLTRRVVEEDSVICRTHAEIQAGKGMGIPFAHVFLGTRWENSQKDSRPEYALKLAIRVPDYEIDNKLWFDEHFEGSYLFQDTILFRLQPDPAAPDGIAVYYDWASQNRGTPQTPLSPKNVGGNNIYSIEFVSNLKPGIRGRLRFRASDWNEANGGRLCL